MARTILIRKGAGVTMSTIGFLELIELTRQQFLQEEQHFMEAIYLPHDHEGQQFICLWDEGRESFNAFYRATRAAREAAIRAGLPIPDYEWEELMEKLRADPRWDGA